MRLLKYLLTTSSVVATATQSYGQCSQETALVDLTQQGYKLAWTFDSKNWDALSEVFVEDVQYNYSTLGHPWGTISSGLEAAKTGKRKAFQDSYTQHRVTNLFIKEMQPGRANVIAYVTVTRWDKNALEDIQKTYRIQALSNSIWVCQGATWKMARTDLTNMGPAIEAPFFGSQPVFTQ